MLDHNITYGCLLRHRVEETLSVLCLDNFGDTTSVVTPTGSGDNSGDGRDVLTVVASEPRAPNVEQFGMSATLVVEC